MHIQIAKLDKIATKTINWSKYLLKIPYNYDERVYIEALNA
jgi:hypothetical protein